MSRSATTSIHRVTLGEAKTWCGIKLLRRAREACALPALVERPGWRSRPGASKVLRWHPKVKIVTVDAYNCGLCARTLTAFLAHSTPDGVAELLALRKARRRLLRVLLDRSHDLIVRHFARGGSPC
jgi:hypothetical protein